MAVVSSPRQAVANRDAQRNAEHLFESQSIAQIREVGRVCPSALSFARLNLHVCVEQVETKARNDIEDKKHQLRQLVGGSYRCVFTLLLC